MRSVSLERRYQLRRKRDRAPALAGFQLGKAEPAAGSFRASPSVSYAAGWAVVAVAFFATDVRITGPVVVEATLEPQAATARVTSAVHAAQMMGRAAR